MQTVTLQRIETSDHGTIGRLKGPHFAMWTIEPPWRGNQRGLSCIPSGSYRAVWHRSPRYGHVYLVTGVPERSHILIHGGNVGGDSTQGLKTHTRGCILPGRRRGSLTVNSKKQKAVLVSRPAVRELAMKLNREPFTLEVFD